MPDAAFGALVSLGWDDRVAALFSAVAEARMVPARVVRVERSACVVAAPDGDHLVRTAELPAVGDWVALHVLGDDRTVAAVVPSWSRLTRRDGTGRIQVLAANVDLVLITAPADRLSPARVEREATMAWDSGARPVVLVTKSDLADPRQVDELRDRLVGIDMAPTSMVTGEGVDDVAAMLRPCRTAVLLGPSGAGKSSLANALVGEPLMATGEVRDGDRRGRHTTTSRQLLVVPTGGILIDTPGLRSLSLSADATAIAAVFGEIESLASACRFGDCRHDREPGCAVTAALADGRLDSGRLASYRKLQREMDFEDRRDDPLARRQAVRVWKARTKASRQRGDKR